MGTSKHIIGILLFFMAVMSSCVYDDQSDCTLNLKFRYVYNMQNADGFTHEADEVQVYIFDSNKQFVGKYSSPVGDEETCTMQLPLLKSGKYTFVAWAYSKKEQGELANFDLQESGAPSSIEALSARLQRVEGKANHHLNSWLNGTLEAEVSGSNRNLTIDMMKCTNAIRVILMPARAGNTLESSDYDIHIEGRNGWLAYDASPYQPDSLTYYPYYQKLEKNSNNNNTAEIDNAVVADLNTSRIMYGSNPRLVVRNSKLDKELLNIDLAWFLSLQAIGEHKSEWSNQEYLDRQDEYAMTFFIDNDTWMRARILVNGWALSLESTKLK